MQECKTVFEEFFMQMTAALIAVDSELRFEAANNLGHPQIESYYQQTYDQE